MNRLPSVSQSIWMPVPGICEPLSTNKDFMQRVAQAYSSKVFSPVRDVNLALYDELLSDADRPLLAGDFIGRRSATVAAIFSAIASKMQIEVEVLPWRNITSGLLC